MDIRSASDPHAFLGAIELDRGLFESPHTGMKRFGFYCDKHQKTRTKYSFHETLQTSPTRIGWLHSTCPPIDLIERCPSCICLTFLKKQKIFFNAYGTFIGALDLMKRQL